MKIAVIPARGGSKRIPGKNIRDFCGKPIIAYSIDAALASGCFDTVIVSTDDDAIAAVARKYGAEVPFRRPTELSNDIVGTIPVTAHAVRWFEENRGPLDLACCIYATAPFVRADDIKRGLERLEASGADYAFSVASFGFPIQRAIRILPSGRAGMFQPEHFNTRSQDLEEAFQDAGQFYWGTPEAWKAGTPMFSEAAVPVILPRWRVQDIDTEEDWKRAELMFRALQSV
jgi:pseudaminic acid cytidylyltransferase